MSDGDRSDTAATSAKWRCGWCDKPHDRNDPPCDNCGHHKFEKAVVPVAPDDPDHQPEPVWACPECGRVHQKNSPPCSRCGHASLDRRVPDEADYNEELSGTSYLDLLDVRYAAGLAVALVAGVVLVLAFLGVVTLPGMGQDVPGSAESLAGVDLSDTEAAFATTLNERRASASLTEYERVSELDGAARLYNRGWVNELADRGSRPSSERLREELDGACEGRSVAVREYARSFTGSDDPALDSPDALASALADAYEDDAGGLSEAAHRVVGVDVHAGPSDRAFVTVVAC